MRLELRIATDSDAFAGEDQAPELIRCLERVCDKLASGKQEGNILDLNGNTVGAFLLDPDGSAPQSPPPFGNLDGTDPQPVRLQGGVVFLQPYGCNPLRPRLLDRGRPRPAPAGRASPLPALRPHQRGDMSMHRTVLTVLTAEPVTPDYLAQRIGEAAGRYGALRPGEGIELPSDPSRIYQVSDTPVELPDFLSRLQADGERCEGCGGGDDGTQSYCEHCGAPLVDPKHMPADVHPPAAS